MRFRFSIARWGGLLVQRLAESCDDLGELGSSIGVRGDRSDRAHDELEWRFHLRPNHRWRPEIRRRENRAQDRADIATRFLPGCYRGIDTAIRWLVRDEASTQLRADVVHRRALIREELEQPDAFILPVIVEGEPKDTLRSAIVRPLPEHESGTAFRALNAPAGEDARDCDDVLLGVSAVDAERVQLEQLARVVLVDACRLAPPIFRHFVHSEPPPSKERAERARREGTRRDTLRIVEVEQHRRTFGCRDEQVLEAAQRAWPDGLLDIRRQKEAIGPFADKDIEMIRPEIDHDFSQLALRQRGAHDRELLQLATELTKFSHRSRDPVGSHRVARLGQLPLHALPLALRVTIPQREILPVIVEDLESVLPVFKRLLIDAIGIELPFDPPHHAAVRHTVHLAGTRPIRQAIQRVERGVVRRHRRRRGRYLRRERRRHDQWDRDQQGNSHSPILTVVPTRS